MILGIDLGSNSVGWSLVRTEHGRPRAIVAAGVRIFKAGVEGDFESGGDQSRNVKRRVARQLRRQTWRRQRRKQKLFRILQRHGLVPKTPSVDPTTIHDCLNAFDRALKEADSRARLDEGHRERQTLLYRLRARAATGSVEPFELGRALYHLAQRRGFLSNRRSPLKADEELGQVKQAIRDLRTEMETSGIQTLGGYLASLDPDQERIRGRWTGRDMYKEEFEAIRKAQEQHHPGRLPDVAWKEIEDAIFFQRPLRSQKGLVGNCELEPECRRAPLALLISQRFRMLQKVNDLRLRHPDGTERWLEPDERTLVLDQLEKSGGRTFAAVRKLLRAPRGSKFSHEEGGEKNLVGNRTAAAIRDVIGERWDALSADDRDRLVDDLLTFEKEPALARRARHHWKLSSSEALELAALRLEEGYAAHSVQALSRLVPRMEEALSYSEARKDEYPDSFQAVEPLPALPPVTEALSELRNPAVERVLTELRKVVNNVIRVHGKPERIHVELARELKHSRKRRRTMWQRARKNETKRKAAVTRLKGMGIAHPKARDIEKMLLLEECGYVCPYTGEPISPSDLFGENPRFDIEHILPYSRTLSNAFANKTLCLHEENRNVKGNKTPFEAYGGTDRWEEIIGRVKRFEGDGAFEKLRRFQVRDLSDEIEGKFLDRQLNDTAYASRLAGEYLGLLYGGVVDREGSRRVQASAGRATALLRGRWKLNQILGGGEKNRLDHRHHAIDATVVALTDAGTLKKVTAAAQRAERLGIRDARIDIDPPWPSLLEDLRGAVDGIDVSHRVHHKLLGRLHEDTLYGPARSKGGGKSAQGTDRHVRKKLAGMSPTEVKKIVDKGLRRRVEEATAGRPPKEAFKETAALPTVEVVRGGQTRVITTKRARIRKAQKTISVGKGPRQRNVATGENHHLEVIEETDSNGGTRWNGVIVSRFEAVERWRSGAPIIARDPGPGRRFLFSLSPGDSVAMEIEGEGRGLCVIQSVSSNQIELRRNRDARPISEIKKVGVKGGRLPWSVERLRNAGCNKVTISPIGDVIPAND